MQIVTCWIDCFDFCCSDWGVRCERFWVSNSCHWVLFSHGESAMDFDMATHHFPPLGSRQGGQGGNMGKLCVCVLSSLKLLEAVKDGTSRSWVSLARAGGLEHLIIWGPVVPCRAPHGRAGPILAWLFRCSRFIMPWRVRVFRSHRQFWRQKGWSAEQYDIGSTTEATTC